MSTATTPAPQQVTAPNGKTVTLRRPTSLASWPTVLLAGIDHAGKSYLAAQASGSDLVGQTFWIEFGETTGDPYGAVPGADYTMIEHDGTYQGLLAAVQVAVSQPRVEPNKPNLIIFDGGTELWDLNTAEQDVIARLRARRKAERSNGRLSPPEADDAIKVSNDQWNDANRRFYGIIQPLRKHDGPVIITCRLALATIMDAAGQPTKEKDWTVKTQKGLPFAVDVMLQMRAHRSVMVTGTRSPSKPELTIEPGNDGKNFPDFTFDKLWRTLGLDSEATQPRNVVLADVDAGVAEQWSAAADEDNVPLPGQVVEEITAVVKDDAMSADEKAQTLLAIRSLYGAEVLRKVGPCWNMSADQAITYAIDKVRTTAAETPAAAVAEPTESVPPTGPEDDPDAGQPDAPEQPDTRERPDDRQPPAADSPTSDRAPSPQAPWLEEVADIHCPVFGVQPSAYVRPLLEGRREKSAGTVPVSILKGWVFTQRQKVIAELEKQGRAASAEKLRKASAQKPALARDVLEGDDDKAA